MAEAAQLYATFGSRAPLARRVEALPGGFDRTWTLAELQPPGSRASPTAGPCTGSRQ